MRLILVLLFSAALSGIAWPLGLGAQVAIVVFVFATSITGRLVNRLVQIDEPFFEFLIGFALISHLLLLLQLIYRGGTWPIFFCLGLLCIAALRMRRAGSSKHPEVIGIAVFVAVFTVVWCASLASRLNLFQQTGRLQFWIDIIVHAGTIAQFTVDSSINRGMVLMADVPQPLYHVASYMPAAAIARIMNILPLDAAVLIWIPVGILVMAVGTIALGYALGGWQLAALALAAMAFIPAPEQLTLGNGLLGFSWLLETAPGTPYSLGISSAAIAALVYWIRKPGLTLLVTTVLLVAACFLIRVNTFIWLAPLIALGIGCGAPRLSTRSRVYVSMIGSVVLSVFLIAISWSRFRSDPETFLFSYIELVHLGSHPTNYDSLYPWLTTTLGRPIAATIGVALVLFGTLGPWLPVFLLFAVLPAVKSKLRVYDIIPFLLLAVASMLMFLAPIPQNGDISEFRHRAGPILVTVISVWSLRFILLTGSLLSIAISEKASRTLVVLVGILSIVSMSNDISSSRQPKMTWAQDVYDKSFDRELFDVAAVLKAGSQANSRFVVAEQSRNARNIDNAALITTLSGVPAYISCPQSLLGRSDYIGEEARRRMLIAEKLSAAPNIEALRAIMVQENITYFVVTSRKQALFDLTRDAAIWKEGAYAIYGSG